MTTTCMKDSIVGDAWIQQAVALNPIKRLDGSTFLTCPVRLSYIDNLFVAKAYKNPDGTLQDEKFGCSLIFPPAALDEMDAEILRIGAAKWPESYSGGQLYGVKMPIRDQGERGNKAGYTPGLRFVNANSMTKPGIWDRPPLQAPLLDKGKVYPGVWALASIGFYCSTSRKTIACGLNGITLYADDSRLGGVGGPSEAQVKDHFAGMRAGAPIAVPSMGGQAGTGTPGQAAAPLSDADLLRQMMGN